MHTDIRNMYNIRYCLLYKLAVRVARELDQNDISYDAADKAFGFFNEYLLNMKHDIDYLHGRSRSLSEPDEQPTNISAQLQEEANKYYKEYKKESSNG